MSTCSIIVFRGGKADGEEEFKNSWGGSAAVWNALYNMYVKDHAKEYDSWMMGNIKGLWDLAKNKSLPMFERAVLFLTFDNATVAKENFAQIATHLREFSAKHSVAGNVNHLPAWADFIEICDCEAIGIHATSVNENPWFDWSEEKGEYVPYDMATGTKHYEIYKELAEADAESAVPVQ